MGGRVMTVTQTWQDNVYDALKAAGVGIVSYVPDAGHARVINRAIGDAEMEAVVLTTEEEGVALAYGAWLGGGKAVLLMQSSGVGNCINMLGLVQSCRFPFLALVTMRGEWEEFNPWQEPMGRAVPAVLEAMAVDVRRAETPEAAATLTAQGAVDAFGQDRGVAVLFSQELIGAKKW
ncbi:MAG: phosphonopyruvate decarboxylase [Rhodospirillales bacterium]|nr:MAG: phosphonopyruvate decarboxylase [Rhodospirillales bacterium]